MDGLPLRVLIACGSPRAAAFTALLVRVFGHQSRTARDGASALRTARRHRPDVVLLHLDLPGLGGYECARRLRQQPESADAILVAVRPGPRPVRDDAAIDLELVAPFTPHQLHEVLAAIADLHRRAPEPNYLWADELHRQARRLMVRAREA
jgi:CheY-like chemotaxis protein